jgi:hypothetical protein
MPFLIRLSVVCEVASRRDNISKPSVLTLGSVSIHPESRQGRHMIYAKTYRQSYGAPNGSYHVPGGTR